MRYLPKGKQVVVNRPMTMRDGAAGTVSGYDNSKKLYLVEHMPYDRKYYKRSELTAVT